MGVKRFITTRATQIRSVLYGGFGVSLGAIILYDLTRGAISARMVSEWSLAGLLGGLIVEYILLAAAASSLHIITARSQGALVESMGLPLDKALARAKVRINLLGRTFKSFTDRVENIRALMHSDIELRILMLNPTGPGVSELARARRDLTVSITDEHLVGEIRNSLTRLAKELGRDRVKAAVRLYRHPSPCGVYRIDDLFLITIYISGHGASSPALGTTDPSGADAFCAGFSTTFTEIWDASSTVRVNEALLKAMQI